METIITFSIGETEIQFDDLNIILIPLNNIAVIRQISPDRFHIKDTSSNEGEFHYRQTVYPSPSALIGFLSNYTQITPFDGGMVLTEPIDLTATGTYTIPVPTGYVFFCTEVGITAITGDTVSVQPNVQFGVDGDTDAYMPAGLTTGLGAPYDWFAYTSTYRKGETTALKAIVNMVAVATELTGRLYFKGFYLKNETPMP